MAWWERKGLGELCESGLEANQVGKASQTAVLGEREVARFSQRKGEGKRR
jgi:hypothetical protein